MRGDLGGFMPARFPQQLGNDVDEVGEGVDGVIVQLAVAWGVQGVGTASPANHEFLADVGVHPVEYGPGLANRVRDVAPGGVDVALDCAGGGAVEQTLHLGVVPARVGTIADHGTVARHGVRRPGGPRTAENLLELVDLHTAGKLRLTVHATFPFTRAAAAAALVDTRHVRGEVVLTTG